MRSMGNICRALSRRVDERIDGTASAAVVDRPPVGAIKNRPRFTSLCVKVAAQLFAHMDQMHALDCKRVDGRIDGAKDHRR